MKKRSTSSWLFITCGVWLVSLGLYFMLVRPPLLPEDPRFMGTTLEQIQAQLPGLARWLRLVFFVLGGFMVSTGILTLHLGWRAIPAKLPGTALVAALSVLVGMGQMSIVNFGLSSDFRWVLLAPPLLGVVGCILLALER